MSYSRETPDKILRNKEIILTKSDIEKFVEFSEEFGEFCARWKTSNKTISTSQIRGIYEKVRRLPVNFNEAKVELQLLRPKLAYQKGRHPQLFGFQKVFDELIKNIDSDEKLQNFKDFFEAVIAYHKAYDGGD